MTVLAGGTLVGIGRELAAAGFGATSGKPYHHATIRAILQNPRNAGLRGYTTRGSDGRRATQIIGLAQWPSIVDEDTYRAACALLSDSARRTNGVGSARKWLLGGLALCGRCDDGVTTVRVSYRGRANADGLPVRTYRCRVHPHLSRAAAWCDAVVIERVVARLGRGDARDLLVDDDREDVAELRQEADTLNTRLAQLAEAFADGTISSPQLKAGTERLRARLGDVEARTVHVDRAPLLADLVNADDVDAAWDDIGLDRQRAVVDLLYTVTLMPRPPGNRPAPLESVRMEPKT
jgi:hypothetical protein